METPTAPTTAMCEKDAASTLSFDDISVDASQHDQASWVARAAEIFKEFRVVVVKNLFCEGTTDKLWTSLQKLHQEWGAKYDKERVGNRCPGRYDMGTAYNTRHATHLPGYLEALEEFAQNGGLQFLDDLGGYKFVGGGGALCLAHTDNWQPLHSDCHGPVAQVDASLVNQAQVPFLDMGLTVHPLTSTNGAFRILPGQPSNATIGKVGEASIPTAPTLESESEASKRSQLHPLPAGCAVFRDIRVWHGGVPNTSDEDRYIPVLQFYSLEAMINCHSTLSEGRGVAKADFFSKLSVKTQQIVSMHILRAEGDESPRIEAEASRWPGSFYQNEDTVPQVHWLSFGSECALAQAGESTAPAFAFDGNQSVFESASEILSSIVSSSEAFQIEHDSHWEKYPEVGEAFKAATGKEQRFAIASSHEFGKWAIGVSSNWRGREEAAKLALAVAIITGTAMESRLRAEYPQLGVILDAGSVQSKKRKADTITEDV